MSLSQLTPTFKKNIDDFSKSTYTHHYRNVKHLTEKEEIKLKNQNDTKKWNGLNNENLAYIPTWH